jgi:hypothetical protein
MALKDKVRFELLVDPDDPSTLILKPIDDELLDNSQYIINLKDIEFVDGTFYSNKEVFYTKPTELYVPLDDVKQLTSSLVPDDILLKHIATAGKTAVYWAKKNVMHESQVPDFSKEDFGEEYYPFYQFIKYKAAVSGLKEYYVELISNPKKWKDQLSDLQREEEWDFGALNKFIEGLEKEADEWLSYVVTITADPKWALRGKHFYSKGYVRTHPFHNTGWGTYTHNNFDRGF